MKYLFILFFLIPFPAYYSVSAQSTKTVKPPAALVDYLYRTASGKENLRKLYGGDLRAAVRDLQVKAVDIDRDRQPEYLVRRKSQCAAAPCEVKLYRRQGKSYAPIFSAVNLDVSPEWGDGRRVLVACETKEKLAHCIYYKWNKREYVQFKCLETDTTESKLKVKPVPCREIN